MTHILITFAIDAVFLGLAYWQGWREGKKSTALKPNQATITVPIEPSADIREAVAYMAQMRVAMMSEGMTSEQASQQIADILAAQQRGQS